MREPQKKLRGRGLIPKKCLNHYKRVNAEKCSQDPFLLMVHHHIICVILPLKLVLKGENVINSLLFNREKTLTTTFLNTETRIIVQTLYCFYRHFLFERQILRRVSFSHSCSFLHFVHYLSI